MVATTSQDGSSPSDKASATHRRLTAQRVREARDRLTSTTGTRPAFDYELLRHVRAEPAVRPRSRSCSLVATIGFLSGLWTSASQASVWTAAVMMIHGIIVQMCRKFLAEPPGSVDIRGWRMRFVLLDLFFGLAWMLNLVHLVGGDEGADHLHAVRHAAGRGRVQHAGVEPADGGVRRDRAGDHRGRPQLRAARKRAQLHPGRHGGHRAGLLRDARAPAVLDHAGDAGGARREGRADRRARAGQGEIRRSAPACRSREPRQVALPGADEPRAAHAAQRHPGLFRGDEERSVRPARGADLQGICRRHPQLRRAPAQPDQRDPRPVAHRGRPLRAQRGADRARRTSSRTATTC